MVQLANHFAADPASLTEENASGVGVLHLATLHQMGEHAPTLVTTILELAPQLAQRWLAQRSLPALPLHFAVSRRHCGAHESAIVMALLQVYPDGARQTTVDDLMPLHIAVINTKGEARAATVTALLAAYPPAARHRSSEGLPLHIAAMYQRGEEGLATVTAILNAYPLAAQEIVDDHLPLTLAIWKQTGTHSVEIVTTILNGFPGAAKHTHENGWLPLHFAATYQTGPRGVAIVRGHCSLHTPRRFSRLPLSAHFPCTWRFVPTRWSTTC